MARPTSARECPTCHGSGEVGVRDRRTGEVVREFYGQYVTQTCPQCEGEGWVA